MADDPVVAQPHKPTILSLPYYAHIMGINPVHFQGADATAIGIFPVGSCSDVWPRYAWQNADRISREQLAHAIYDAEQDIARVLGYYPAPYWVYQEIHRFPRHHRPDVYQHSGLNVRGARKSIQAKFGKFIQAGQRAVTSIDTATVVAGSLTYTDEDGDGFAETATVAVSTTLADACELKVYIVGQSGAQGWEIRPARSKSISGGIFTAVFWSWQFIDRDLQAAHPTAAGFSAIDISTTANFVTAVDVYREYNDFISPSATFYWEPDPANLTSVSTCTSCGGTGCVACSLTSQDGCLHVRDTESGIVVPVPATYDVDNATWTQDAYSVCRDPDQVKINYYAGEYDNRWLGGESCEALSNYWAHAIAWLATARLDRPPCSCANVKAKFDNLQEDLALTASTSHQVTFQQLNNPFGTRRGEMLAWQRVDQIAGVRMSGGGAI